MTDDLVARVERMANQKKAEKQALWDRVKGEYPEHAEFASAVAQVFGKPDGWGIKDQVTGEKLVIKPFPKKQR